MPKRQAEQCTFTYHVHRVSVNEGKSSNWLIQNEMSWARGAESSTPTCKQTGIHDGFSASRTKIVQSIAIYIVFLANA